MPSDTTPTPTSVRVLRNVDILALAVALPIFIVAGWPLLGWVLGAGTWVLQRLISELAIRKAEAADDPRTKVGLLAGSMIARGWLVAGIILAVGLSNNDAGLSAAVLFLAVFTLQFTMTLAMRPFEKEPPKRRPAVGMPQQDQPSGGTTTFRKGGSQR
jgi:hypothetical protein